MCALTDAEVLQRFPECYRKLLLIESLREILEENAAAAKRNAEEQARKDALKAAKLAALSPAERQLKVLVQMRGRVRARISKLKNELERNRDKIWFGEITERNYAVQIADSESRLSRLDALVAAAERDAELSQLLRDTTNDEH